MKRAVRMNKRGRAEAGGTTHGVRLMGCDVTLHVVQSEEVTSET